MIKMTKTVDNTQTNNSDSDEHQENIMMREYHYRR